MRLDSVEIVGFKSFCDRQELSFQGGVTGIVGPNGCGKSNISDAISWVLGEQSVKSLRGTAMEDVIFAGSQSRQPTGMAEVNLEVSGLNGNSPDGSPECVVTRRLYRNGESEYLMNGHVCRLRDIHELFMDTGLGSKAYSIIEQGKIGLILSSKPADRRALIEEAAGITKYKARRRQTQLKLEAAQQNLLRVNDIVHEVEKQLESLKRQASKARRYRALRDEMQAVERVLYGRRFVDLRGQSDARAARLAAEAQRELSAAIALQSEEAQMEVRRTALYEEEARLQEIRARLSELTLAVDRHQGRSGYCREQIVETEGRAAHARAEAAEAESLRESRAGRREQALARGTAARAEADARAREAEAHQNECSGLAGRRASLEEMVATHSAFDEGVRALLAGPEGIEVLGVVADAVETDSTYERAVEAFLGDRLQAVLTPDTSHALRGIRHLQDSGAGRGAFLPLASARTRADCASLRDVARQEAPTRGLLSDLYRVTGPHAAPIRAALPDALVVETLEDALAIVSRHGPVPCVTLAGETLRGSMVEGGRGVKGLLAPRREIREVSARQDEVEGLLREARERGQEAAARAEAAVADARALEE